jgi:hypothetical protein
MVAQGNAKTCVSRVLIGILLCLDNGAGVS